MAPMQVFLRFNILHGHSITKLLVYNNILIVLKPTTFCNGFIVGFYFNKWLYPSRVDNRNDISRNILHVTNHMFNLKVKYLMLCFKKIIFVCSIIFCWSLLLAMIISHKEHQKIVHLWYSSHMHCKNSISKQLLCPSTNITVRIIFSLSLSYSFIASKFLIKFVIIFPDMPYPQKNLQYREPPPFF